ncbi:hypothetical protein MTR67_029824 [Solanum verrucosum]|uniref:Cytochrome c oxidase subunit VIb n=1 Tax=Solanum verrucosum TaxID=315347 RepID=A0AAF0RDB4_SOLVR|nr:hypothetical protein MTR67_029824 [Solanum verrucosum]
MPSTLRAFQIELKTAPADFRFPTTNQTRHCFTRYVEFHRCVAAKGDEAADCERFAKYYRALCPGEWASVCAKFWGISLVSGEAFGDRSEGKSSGTAFVIDLLEYGGVRVSSMLNFYNPCLRPYFGKVFHEVDKWNEQRENGTFPGPL